MASALLFIMLCVDRELRYCTCCSHDSFWGAFLLLWVTTEENSSLKRCKYVVGLQINCHIRTFVVARWALTVWCVFKNVALNCVISAARTKLAQMNNSFDSWSRFAYKFLYLSKRQVCGNRARERRSSEAPVQLGLRLLRCSTLLFVWQTLETCM